MEKSSKKQVLLYEQDPEKISQLLFLLGLADLKFTVKQTMDEIIGLLEGDAIIENRFDLLLLSSSHNCELLVEWAARMGRSLLDHIPAVHVNHDDCTLHPELRGQIISCPPNALLRCISTQLELS